VGLKEREQQACGENCIKRNYAASYTMGTGGFFPGGKVRPGRGADLFSSSTDVKNDELYPLLLSAYMVCTG
jgi:hypothetical protein